MGPSNGRSRINKSKIVENNCLGGIIFSSNSYIL